ncbi:MAG: nucleotidyltransferase family protein [Pleurocapsa sp.]
MNNSTQQAHHKEDLCAIADLLKNKREEIISIAAKHGAFNVRIFGSVARNEANQDSDIDFLVDYSIDNISPWFPAGLVLDLEKLLGYKVDIATESALKERIKERVLQEAIAL